MFLKIGDKMVEVEEKDGIKTIKAIAKEIKHADGRIDVEVRVPCLKIQQKLTK